MTGAVDDVCRSRVEQAVGVAGEAADEDEGVVDIDVVAFGDHSLRRFEVDLYVVATCAPPLLSGFGAITWFGVVNLVAVGVIATVQAEGLTSVWCLWAAVVSVLTYVPFRSWRRTALTV